MSRFLPALLLSVLLSAFPQDGGRLVAATPQYAASATTWVAGSEVSGEELRREGWERLFSLQAIPDEVFVRMRGKSYPADCSVARGDLRYLRVVHHDGTGHVRRGELVCNKAIAASLLTIFKELYRQKYPIASIRLIDDFDADDERSMRANNTSAFCFRRVKGAKTLSAHARGMAVDINPLYNPYYKKTATGKVTVQPGNALKYCDRTAAYPYKIVRGDLLHRLFLQYGFRWGGAWRTVKDWQHFEK